MSTRTAKRLILCVLLVAGGFAAGYWLPLRRLSPLAENEEGASMARTIDRTDGKAMRETERTTRADVARTRPPPPPFDPSLGREPRFTDVTAASGVTLRHENGRTGKHRYPEIMGAGVGLLDYDGDGDLDIYFVNGNRLFENATPEITNRLYRNDGGWTFTDVTDEAGVGDAGYGQGCCAGDYDRDGDVDLYVTNLGANVLYENDGDGRFREIAREAGVADAAWGQTCSFLDVDRDGRLDLYVQNYLTYSPEADREVWIWVGKRKVPDYPSPLGFRGSPDRLFRQESDGSFSDVTEATGLLAPRGKGMGLACVDLDGNGFTDVFVANDSMENYLFLNRNGARFEEVGLAAGVAFDGNGRVEASMGVDAADYDADGLVDLIVPSLHREVYTLYRNLGGHFEDVSAPAGLATATSKATGFNANFIDYDDDGDLDLFFTAGGVRANEFAAPDASYNERYGIPDILVANDGNGRFTEVSARAGAYFAEALIGRGSAVGDLDQDGDLDLVVSNLADRAVLLRNDTTGGHWITLTLASAGGVENPHGASVRLDAGERRQHAVLHGGVTYLSQSDRRLHFGLGEAERVERLEVRWPGGATQVIEDIPADRFLRIEEGGGAADPKGK